MPSMSVLPSIRSPLAVLALLLLVPGAATAAPPGEIAPEVATEPQDLPVHEAHSERLDQPHIVPSGPRQTTPRRVVTRNGFTSVQVNVDGAGMNIVGDAANEPSIAIDPTNLDRMAIGWRQFDTIASNFRQAGAGRTTDGGLTWTATTLDPGVFRSDPILDSTSDGRFYYHSLQSTLLADAFTSPDAGATWGDPVFAFGGDKAWAAADRSGGPGNAHFYAHWSPLFGCCDSAVFNRTTDGGDSFENPVDPGEDFTWGTVAVGSQGEVYVVGRKVSSGSEFSVAKSTTVQNPDDPMAFDFVADLDMGGFLGASAGPNPGGLLGQMWIAPARGLGVGNQVYVLSSLNPPGSDPLDVHFARSDDGGLTWSAPRRLNDDPPGAWQWFGTLSVAPNGRLDAIWNDSRADPGGFDSALYYTTSSDGGDNWTPPIAVSPSFDPHIGWPNQNKIGDYYDMVSTTDAAHVAYSATFNGEQDVYYLRITLDAFVFDDGFESGDTSAWSLVEP